MHITISKSSQNWLMAMFLYFIIKTILQPNDPTGEILTFAFVMVFMILLDIFDVLIAIRNLLKSINDGE